MNRKMTKKIMKELDEGLRDPRQLCHELLAWMSEDDVASFALVYGHGYDEDEDEDDEGNDEDDPDEETKRDLNELALAEEIESSFFDETWRDDLNWQAV